MTEQQERPTHGWQPTRSGRTPLNLRSPSPAVIALALAAAVAGLVLLVGGCASFDRTNGGEYAVVRDKGPLDDRAVRQVLQPGSSLTWTGLWSTSHEYPATQRFYTITSNAEGGDLPGAPLDNGRALATVQEALSAVTVAIVSQ